MNNLNLRFLLYITLLTAFLIFFGSATPAFSQSSERSNPVIFLDIGTGLAGGEAGGFWGSGLLSVQVKKILISARMTETERIGTRSVGLSPITAIPAFYSKHRLEEGALLAGPRWIFGDKSLSVQAGISYNRFTQAYEENNRLWKREHSYPGIPFQARFQFFNGIKKRYRLYQLLPLTRKPVALGNSIGFTLSGNIAQHTYVGLGLTLGFGFYKKY